MNIQFISSKPVKPYGTTQLRCLQPAEFLRRCGWNVEVGNIRKVTPIRSGVIFFHRTAFNRFTRAFVRYAKNLGNILIYDTDDLTFDENSGSGHIMQLCDAVSVSTEYLRDRCRPIHSNVRVIRNALSYEYFSLADNIYKSKRDSRSEFVTIGYLSGSSTHDDDFLLVQNALLRLLSSNSKTRVLLAGKLTFSEQFWNFKERFEYKEFMPYNEYINLYRYVDINLAPLNILSAFCNGKSELKYMEAGACGVPTIASPTDTYRRTIKHGINGLLAEEGQWEANIRLLIDNVGLRDQIGCHARLIVLESYHPLLRGKELSQIVRDFINKYARKAAPYRAVLYAGLSRFWMHCISSKATHN